MNMVTPRGIATKLKNAKPKDKAWSIPLGENVYFEILPSGKKVFKMRYRKPKNNSGGRLVLGYYPALTYLEAMSVARDAKELVRQGIDPNEQKKHERINVINKVSTFRVVAKQWFDDRVKRLDLWTEANAKKVWRSLELHVFDDIGDMHIAEITPPMVLEILNRMEGEGKTNITKKVNQRIRAVFEFARVRKLIKSNPADGLSHELKAEQTRNNPYIPVSDIHQFFADLEACPSGDHLKIAVEFTMRTLARTGEVRFATWQEFDLDKGLWTVPAERMKSRRIHIVPLSTQVIALLRKLEKMSGKSDYLFLTYSRNKPMSENAMLDVLKRMGWKGRVTVHGLRGTGSTILNEAKVSQPDLFDGDVVESALAHVEKDKTRGAYNHAKYVEKRREMLQWYSDYLDSLKEGAAVIPINRKAV